MVAGLAAGAPKHGPYDAITLQGGVEVVPEALLAQLKDGGRIGVVFMEGGSIVEQGPPAHIFGPDAMPRVREFVATIEHH